MKERSFQGPKAYALLDLGFGTVGTETYPGLLKEAIERKIFAPPAAPLLVIEGHNSIMISREKELGKSGEEITFDFEDIAITGENYHHLEIHPLHQHRHGFSWYSDKVEATADPRILKLDLEDITAKIRHNERARMLMFPRLSRADADQSIWNLLMKDTGVNARAVYREHAPLYHEGTQGDKTVRFGHGGKGYVVSTVFPNIPSDNLKAKLLKGLDVKIMHSPYHAGMEPEEEHRTLRITTTKSAAMSAYVQRVLNQPDQGELF